MHYSYKKGFTLVELLIVIAIIAILAVVGVAVFRGVTNASRDAKRRADLEAIAKAYEIKYSSAGSYQALANTDFAAGAIPKTPEGNNYPCLVGPESNCTVSATDKVAYCVSLGDNQSVPCYSSSNTCYCSSSTQGSSLSGGGGSGGGGSNPSCDPYGVLTSGLVGYWKMDEPTAGTGSWNGAAGEIKDSSNSLNHGTAINGASTIVGQPSFSNAASFDGINDYISIPKSDSWMFYQNDFTLSAWIYQTQNYSYFLGDYPHAGLNGVFFVGNNYTAPYNLMFIGNDSTGNSINRNFGTVLSQNQWNQLLITRTNTTTVTLYLNGQMKSSVTINGDGNFNWMGYTRFAIGSPDGGPFFQGKIDDVRIYNRALSATEVSTLYNNGNGCLP